MKWKRRKRAQGLLTGEALALPQLRPVLERTQELLLAGHYTQHELVGHHPTLGERAQAMTELHMAKRADTMQTQPEWFIEAMAELRDAGVSLAEIQDHMQRGPRAVDQLLLRYGVDPPGAQ